MDVRAAKETVRSYLRAANKTQVARETGISLAWINKFAHGHFDNPSSNRLAFLLDYVNRAGVQSATHAPTVRQ